MSDLCDCQADSDMECARKQWGDDSFVPCVCPCHERMLRTPIHVLHDGTVVRAYGTGPREGQIFGWQMGEYIYAVCPRCGAKPDGFVGVETHECEGARE